MICLLAAEFDAKLAPYLTGFDWGSNMYETWTSKMFSLIVSHLDVHCSLTGQPGAGHWPGTKPMTDSLKISRWERKSRCASWWFKKLFYTISCGKAVLNEKFILAEYFSVMCVWRGSLMKNAKEREQWKTKYSNNKHSPKQYQILAYRSQITVHDHAELTLFSSFILFYSDSRSSWVTFISSLLSSPQRGNQDLERNKSEAKV